MRVIASSTACSGLMPWVWKDEHLAAAVRA
jgi:hypothetical protein